MKKLAELWLAKKGLCVGIIAGVVVLTAGGITTAIVLNQPGKKKEAQVALDETIVSNNKDNQTTKATEINETTQKASEVTTEESEEESTSETQGAVR